MTILDGLIFNGGSLPIAGVAPGVRKDDQLEFQGSRTDHHDDQNSIKQALISSYKKNLYPITKAEIHHNSHESLGSASGPLPSRGN